MLSFQNIPFYEASIWTAVRQTLAYAAAQLPGATPDTAAAVAEVCGQTMANARDNLGISATATALDQLYANLAPVLGLALAVDATTIAYITARVDALQTVTTAVAALKQTPLQPSATLPAGVPAIPYPGFIEWMMTTTPEVAPTSVVDSASFQAAIAESTTAWQNVATALATQGLLVSGATVDAVNQMAAASQAIENGISQITVAVGGGAYTTNQLWSMLSTIPTLLYVADSLALDPTSQSSQELVVLKLLIQQSQDQFNILIANTRDQPPSPDSVKIYTVRQGDTVMTIATRELGDYTRWQDIVAINALQPPYIATTGLPNTVAPGQKIYIPTTLSPVVVTTAPPTYEANYLGTDIYYGPLNQPMTTWTGDFLTVSGYNNLTLSLGRRLQTTLGTLIFHQGYGSRIPPQIGSTAATGKYNAIAAYAQAAITVDPRVAKITSLTATPGDNYAVNVKATVTPNGFGVTAASVNEVLT